jgi:hypothetical protein
MPTSPPTLPTPVATPGPAGPTFSPPAGGPPVGGPPAAGPPPSGGGGSSKAPFIIGGLVLVALIVAGFLLFKGDDGGGGQGSGTFTLDVPKNGNATHKISTKDNEFILVTVTPKDKSFDPIIGEAVDVKSAGAKAIADIFSADLSDVSSELSDIGKVPATIVSVHNNAGAGKKETFDTPSPKALTVTVVVGGANGAAGKVDVKVEIVSVQAKDKALDYLKEACKNAKVKAFDQEACARVSGSDASTDSTSDFTDFSSFTDFSDSFSDFTDFSNPFSDFSDLTDFSSLFSDFSSFSDFFSS